jgi:hypothetical protein
MTFAIARASTNCSSHRGKRPRGRFPRVQGTRAVSRRSTGSGPSAVPGTSPTSLRSTRSVPSHRFQALFHSLFRVLFIFPSRYFFAIGLSPVFSLRWNLPPNLGCILKQPDSTTASRGGAVSGVDGVFTLSDVPFQGTWARSAPGSASLDYNSRNEVP